MGDISDEFAEALCAKIKSGLEHVSKTLVGVVVLSIFGKIDYWGRRISF